MHKHRVQVRQRRRDCLPHLQGDKAAQAQDKLYVIRSTLESDTAEIASLLSQAPVFLLLVAGRRCGTSPTRVPL